MIPIERDAADSRSVSFLATATPAPQENNVTVFDGNSCSMPVPTSRVPLAVVSAAPSSADGVMLQPSPIAAAISAAGQDIADIKVGNFTL
jgi:hypothetical protein